MNAVDLKHLQKQLLKWYRMNLGVDNLDQNVSPEQARWDEWQRQRSAVAAE